MHVDSTEFPLSADYVRHLPRGLASFPECQVRAVIFESLPTDFPELGRRGWPEPLCSLLTGKLPAEAWLPEVVGQTANLLVRDLVRSDDAYFEWAKKTTVHLFDRPLLRHLMKLISPTLVVIGAKSRWDMLHRGTSLSATPVRKVGSIMQTRVSIAFPADLFPLLYLEGLAASFETAVSFARGLDPNVKLSEFDAMTAEYIVSWNT